MRSLSIATLLVLLFSQIAHATISSSRHLLRHQHHIHHELLTDQERRQLQGLEIYQSKTPPPSLAPVVATAAPTSRNPTLSPTAEPTLKPTTKPTDAPTRNPTDAPTRNPTDAPTREPTDAPTIKPTVKPTEMPTEMTTVKPSEMPTDAPTVSPTSQPTTQEPTAPPSSEPTEKPPKENQKEKDDEKEPQAEESTEAPTTVSPAAEDQMQAEMTESFLEGDQQQQQGSDQQPQVEPTTAPVAAAPTATESLYDAATEYESSMGEISIEISLFCPTKDPIEWNFMKVEQAIKASIANLICETSNEKSELCVVRDTVLLPDGDDDSSGRQAPMLDAQGNNATVLALASTQVHDDSGVAPVALDNAVFTWTTWRLTWDVLQLGSILIQHIESTYGNEGKISQEESLKKGLEMLQEMMAVEMEQAIREGVLEKDLNKFMGNTRNEEFKTSMAGEEEFTFGPQVDPNKHQAAESEAMSGEDQGGPNLMIVFFFAGLGVAGMVIVTLLYFSFRSRRSGRKRGGVVVIDDTSQGCTDSKESSDPHNRIIVIDTEEALRDDPPRQRMRQSSGDQVPAASNSTVNNNSTSQQMSAMSEVEEGAGTTIVDLESHFNAQQSIAQSSMYTGTGSNISAITGMSGLSADDDRKSDTWSVGSLSIDFAEWG